MSKIGTMRNAAKYLVNGWGCLFSLWIRLVGVEGYDGRRILPREAADIAFGGEFARFKRRWKEVKEYYQRKVDE